jgi:hypothetical protein
VALRKLRDRRKYLKFTLVFLTFLYSVDKTVKVTTPDGSLPLSIQQVSPSQPEQIAEIDSTIKVSFRGDVSRDTIELEFSPDLLVEVVKRKCIEKLPNTYRLMYEGEELEDERMMSSYDFGSDVEALECAFRNLSKVQGLRVL